MKLGTLKNDTRDGALVVVSKNLKHAVVAYEAAPTLQSALDDWGYIAAQLKQLYDDLNRAPGPRAFELDPRQLAAPLPRAYQWLDASAYLPHVELVRKARGAAMPAELGKNPLMYQGDSDYFIGPCDPIEAAGEDWGIDLEAEIAVFLGDVPMGVNPDRAGDHIRLLALVNDVSFRELIPAELAKGFGFLHGKGATAFSPVAVTPDELGDAWDGKEVRLPVTVHVNDRRLGAPDCGTDMQFDFPHLIAHAARTRHRARFGNDLEPRSRDRTRLHRRDPRPRSAAERQSRDAIPQVRRSGENRNAGSRRPDDFRRHRAPGRRARAVTLDGSGASIILGKYGVGVGACVRGPASSGENWPRFW